MTKHSGDDPEIPLEDALEQEREARTETDDRWLLSAPTLPDDANPADAEEQRIEVPLDEEDHRDA
jgi:hypothetical protein